MVFHIAQACRVLYAILGTLVCLKRMAQLRLQISIAHFTWLDIASKGIVQCDVMWIDGIVIAQLTYMISHSQDMTQADLKVKYEEKYLDFILCETGLWSCLENLQWRYALRTATLAIVVNPHYRRAQWNNFSMKEPGLRWFVSHVNPLK